MISAILLDLDDTLYDEADYVRSGLAVVAERIAGLSGHAPAAVLETLVAVERRDGRGKVFDTTLRALGVAGDPTLVRRLVTAYRMHRPEIDLEPDVRRLLTRLGARHRLAIVTDGLPSMQRRKIAALDLEPAVDAVVYTWELRAPKPNPAGFLLALDRLGVAPDCAVVVGDNPGHDVAAARAIGARSIRVRRGRFADLASLSGAPPEREIDCLEALETALASLEKVPAHA
jgi:putative hydrolase of the HAD superfamily